MFLAGGIDGRPEAWLRATRKTRFDEWALELEVCARARLLVTCNEALVNESLAAGNQPRCAKCAKMRSGFTERVVALHKARGEGKRVAW